MKLYIRADGDGKIGTGHIMRCIALAQTWQDQGGEVTFISHCDSVPLKQRMHDEGISLIPIDRVCPDPSDIETTLSILKKDLTDKKTWLVLDGYHFTSEYQKAIREKGIRLLVMDDMNHLTVYHADILLNQNIHAAELKYHCDDDTTLLVGTRYVFLRREFLKYWDFKRQIPDRAKNILVSLGGADPDNVTLKVIQALDFLGGSQIEITIIVGPANLHELCLRSALESTNLNYNLLINPPNMVDLMANTDLGISAGGGTYWELAYMGVPCIMIVLAENQRVVAEELAKTNTVINLGWHHLLSSEDMAKAVYPIIVSHQMRSDMSHRGQAMIDGNGAILTVNAMRSHRREVAAG